MFACWRFATRSALILMSCACLLLVVYAESTRHAQTDRDRVLSAAVNCSHCMHNSDGYWCPDVGNARCGSSSLSCKEKLISPKSEVKILSDAKPSVTNQFSVQKFKVQLREVINMSASFHQVEDYPVDLYFLSDRSESMKDDLETTKKLGGALRDRIRQISNQAQIGLGVFIDKPVPPYFPQYNPNGDEPDGFLSFYNVLPLTDDFSEFAKSLGNITTKGNLDSPEGGFDALMQAIVCSKWIKWRKDALRIIVYVSDALFHHAGDGKLAGIVKPNDGECHLEDGKYYTKSTEQDYPSVSHISYKAVRNSMNVLFAVTENVIDHYRAVTARIATSSVNQLTSDSSNVVDVVVEQYMSIVSTLKMTYQSSEHVQLRFYTNCSGEWLVSDECQNIRINDVVHWQIEIKRKSCPPPGKRLETVTVTPDGRTDAIEIEVEYLCDCDCDTPSGAEMDAGCSNHGQQLCGKCKCGEGYIGEKCECDQDSFVLNSTSNCVQHEGDEPCNGAGSCVCNQCQCQDDYTGTYCECSNKDCEHSDGKLCGGHGECVCGFCQCETGWNGTACQCSQSKDTCRGSPQGLECSGHGKCVCGACVCDETEEGRYIGELCETCLTCNPRCDTFEPCVKCVVFESGPLHEDATCAEACQEYNITVVDEIEDDDVSSRICNINDDDNCRIKFRVVNEAGKVYIRVKKEKICPPPINILNIVLTLIAAIVVVGMAILMLWKLLTVIHDRREYAKWDSERKAAKWETGENPIYKQATSTYKNPAFGR